MQCDSHNDPLSGRPSSPLLLPVAAQLMIAPRSGSARPAGSWPFIATIRSPCGLQGVQRTPAAGSLDPTGTWACAWYGSVLMTLLGNPMGPWLIHRTSAWAGVSGDGDDSRPRVLPSSRAESAPRRSAARHLPAHRSTDVSSGRATRPSVSGRSRGGLRMALGTAVGPVIAKLIFPQAGALIALFTPARAPLWRRGWVICCQCVQPGQCGLPR